VKREWLDGLPAGRWRALSGLGLHEWGGLPVPLAPPSSAAHPTNFSDASRQPLLTFTGCHIVASHWYTVQRVRLDDTLAKGLISSVSQCILV